MKTFSEEEQNDIIKERKDKEHQEMLEAAHDRIVQGIANNKTRSGERAIWELMQNARDSSRHAAEILIRLTSESFSFAHKGDNFTLDTLSRLIKQQSSKHHDEDQVSKHHDEDQVGQYGTGFMSTHTFSTIVHIAGDVLVEHKGKKLYIPLPDDFCLNRSFDDKRDFTEEMDRELHIVENDIPRRSGSEESHLYTTFTYELTDEKIANKVSAQLDTTIKLMPYVIVFNDKIEQCEIKNEVSGNHVIYTRDSQEPILNKEKYVLMKYSIQVSTSKEPLQIFCLESSNHKDRIILPELPKGYDDTSNIPSQFLFFPLLGSEQFGTNFILHSSRLYPVESRDSYQLPCDNNNVTKEYKHNEEVIDEMFDMLFTYYKEHEDKQCIPLDFADVNFVYNGNDQVTEEYYQKLQDKFSSEFIKWKMIPTDNGNLAIDDDNQLVVLEHSIYASLNEEQVAKYIPVISKYARRSKLIPNKNVLEWSQVVYHWRSGETRYYVNMKDICSSIKTIDSSLHTFLEFLITMGEEGKKMIELYDIIPNREGELCCFGNLRDASFMDDRLYAICKPLLGSYADRLVKTDYNKLTTFTAYTLDDLKNEVKSKVEAVHKLTIDRLDEKNMPSPISLDELEGSPFSVEDLIKFCSLFWTANPDDNRARLMKLICEIYGVAAFEPIIYLQESEHKTDYTLAPFNFLLESTMVKLSKKSPEWLKADDGHERNYQLLRSFVKEFVLNGNDKTRMKRLDEIGVIPNQLGNLCIASELKINKDGEITEPLQKVYRGVKGIDLKSIFVDDGFAEYYQFEEYTGKKIGGEIEEKLCDNNYAGNETLIILDRINHNEWGDFFPNMKAQRKEIYYNHGSEADRKALFTLQMQGSEKLKCMEELAKSDRFDAILDKAKDLLKKEKEQIRQFNFTFTIGKLVEDIIREEVGSELYCSFSKDMDSFSADDVQNGQDIIIYKNGVPVYYIECKAKWNFANQAHMSSNQIKKAFTEKGHYALCCIDCTADTGCCVAPDASKEEVYTSKNDILHHAYILDKVDTLVKVDLNPLIKQEDDTNFDERTFIKVYSYLSTNISKKIFTSGKPFILFIRELIVKLKGK